MKRKVIYEGVCVICGGKLENGYHFARPIEKGICCNDCYERFVKPERKLLRQMDVQTEKKEVPRVRISQIMLLINELADIPKERAMTALERYESMHGINENIRAVFEIADRIRAEH